MFDNLIDIDGVDDQATSRVKKQSTSAKPKKPKAGLGCDFCPSKMNWKHGVKPIFGEVTGKKIFIWAQSPGPKENKQGKELIGPSGEWLWIELRKVGITREMCDVQNVVRCYPANYQQDDWPPLEMRNPEKLEIKCCSKFTQEAIEKSKARVHLVFGAVAHKAVLGQEYKKVRKTFYSSRLKGQVFLLDHPSFFLRGGFGGKGQQRVPTDRLKQFRRMIRDAAEIARHGVPGKYSYIKSRKYVKVTTPELLDQAYRAIKKAKFRVAVDSEHGWVDGKHVHLCIAFVIKPGYGYVIPTDIPGEFDPHFLKLCKEHVGLLLEDEEVKKIFHHGNSDVEEARELLGFETKGYEYETEYAEYFVYPVDKQSTYGLEAIGDRRFPMFGGWKEIILPEAFTDEWLEQKKKRRENLDESQYMKLYEAAKKEKGLNYAQVPWDKLALRCIADADITKRIELTTKQKCPMPLLRIYRDSAFTLGRMEKDGPLFDFQHVKLLRKLFPVRVKRHLHKLQRIAGEKDFNPGSNKHGIQWLLFDKLKLDFPFEGKPNTQKDTLSAMLGQHEAVELSQKWRKDKKTESTYLDGFEACASINNGRLRTKWWQTGTGTGRLSSGGGKEKKTGDKSVVNLQNIHGDPLVQCLAISDPRWREVYNAWLQRVTITKIGVDEKTGKPKWKYDGGFTEDDWQEFEDFHVFLGFDFAQMEIRFLAELSGDREYQKMFMDPHSDPHSMVGHALTGWPIERIKADERVRRIIKALHFGIIYGLQAPGLVANLAAQGIKVTVDEMKKYIDRYFQRFKGVKKWLDDQVKRVERLGYTETPFGFQRPINVEEQKYLGEEWTGSYWGNQARNSPIQGGAHQMMLFSVAALQRKPEHYSLLNHPQLEIHDALYFRLKLKYLWRALKQGVELLEVEPVRVCKEDFGIDWKTPLKAEGGAGFRFGAKVKDIGIGAMTKTHLFLNKWCEKNRDLVLKAKMEIAAVA